MKRILLFAWLAFGLLGPAQAQDYPQRVIKMIVPATAGGQTDVLARMLADKLKTSLGQSVMIENRVGAGGAIGARAAAAAEPDGYTIFFGNTSTLAVIPAVSKNPGYDPAKNYAPIASISESYMILCVHPSFPAKTLQEFLSYAKANPGKLNFGNAGAGNVTHLTGEMFKSAAGLDFVNIPYPGGAETITALLGNQIHFVFESPVVLLPLIADGKLRALGVTSGKRKEEAKDIPTLAEAGVPGFEATLLTGVVAPAGTPAPVVAKLNAAINDGLKSADLQQMLAKFGSSPRIETPQAFTAFIAGEKQRWSDVAKKAGVSLD